MDCQQARDLLPLYADGELEATPRRSLERHLADCAECRRRLALDRQLTVELEKMGREKMNQAPSELRGRVMDKLEQRRNWRPWWRAVGLLARSAVMLGVILVFGLLIYFTALQGRPSAQASLAEKGMGTTTADPWLLQPSPAETPPSVAAASSSSSGPSSKFETEPMPAIPTTAQPPIATDVGPVKPTQMPPSTALPVVTEGADRTPTTTVALTPTMLAAPAPSAPASSGTPGIAALPLLSLHMVDADTGWALTQGAVLRTLDGGATWSDVTPSEAKLAGNVGSYGPTVTGSAFLDAEAAWVGFAGTDGKTMVVYGTCDGGRTWYQSSVLGLGGYIDFIDTEHGWIEAGQGAAAGSEGVDIYRTVDGGANWELMSRTAAQADSTPGSLPLGGIKGGLAFRDASVGWTVLSIPTEARPGLYITRDGGRTWQEQAIPLPPELQKAWATAEVPRFFNAREGILPVRFSLDTGGMVRVFYSTSDGGETWSPLSSLKEASAFDFVSPQRGWVAAPSGDGGLVMQTTDGGKSWQAVSSGPDLGQIGQLDFVDGRNGWALRQGEQGSYLLRTTDGGKTWQAVARPNEAALPTPLAIATANADLLPCATDDLSGVVAWQGATGSLAGSLRLTNVGNRACVIGELPLVFGLVDGQGQRLSVEASVAPGEVARLSPPVVLQPGEQVSEQIVWRNWCGGDVQAPLAVQVVQKGVAGTAIANVGDPAFGNKVMTPRCDAPDQASTLSVGPVLPAEAP